MKETVRVGQHEVELKDNGVLLKGAFQGMESAAMSKAEAIALASVLLAFARELRGGEG